VPREVNGYTKDFVQRIAVADVATRVDERFAEIKNALGLKRTEIRTSGDASSPKTSPTRSGVSRMMKKLMMQFFMNN
jgi:hypothetical protein